MTSVRTLILELLLLKERYSTADFRAAKAQLETLSNTDDLRELLAALPGPSDRQASRPKRETSTGAQTAKRKQEFVGRLRASKSPREVRRVERVAERLGIAVESKGQDALLEEIAAALDGMTDVQVRAFLSSTPSRSSADAGYQGLANFLIHSPTHRKSES